MTDTNALPLDDLRLTDPGGTLPRDDSRHGNYATYVNHACKCDRCKLAWQEYCRGRRTARKGALPPDDPRHGTQTGYNNWQCRCDACVAIASAGRRQKTYEPVADEQYTPATA